jgi:hypothetical protein
MFQLIQILTLLIIFADIIYELRRETTLRRCTAKLSRKYGSSPGW